MESSTSFYLSVQSHFKNRFSGARIFSEMGSEIQTKSIIFYFDYIFDSKKALKHRKVNFTISQIS